MNVIAWRAWYADGSTLDSTTTAWSALPSLGLQIVMLYYDLLEPATKQNYKRIMEGNNFYYMTDAVQKPAPDGTAFSQTDDPAIASRDQIDPTASKQGTQISDKAYADLTAIANAAIDPPKGKAIGPLPTEVKG